METPPTFVCEGFSVFESGPQVPGSLTMKYVSSIITFEWNPEQTAEIDVEKLNLEEATIFFFLHTIKKITVTKSEAGNTVLKFSLQEIRTSTKFVFPQKSQESLDEMLQFLISQNFIQQNISDLTSYNVILETEKKYVYPEGKISLHAVSPLIAHRTTIAKLMSDEEKLQKNPISLDEFNSFFGENEKINDFGAFKKEVFKRGLTSEARPYAYSYVLNVNDPNLDHIENIERRMKLNQDFALILKRWNARTPRQEKYSHCFHSVIVSDVKRTDRNTKFFKNDGPGSKALEEILVCFAIELPETGYVQGMCDLAAALVQLFVKEITEESMILYDDKKVSFVEGEAFVFWALYGLLALTGHDKLFMNMDSNRNFVAQCVLSLIQINAPSEARWITQNNQESLIFTLSPLILLFRRCFETEDLLMIWDRLLFNEDPLSYIRFLISASLMLTFPRIMLNKNTNDDMSSGFISSLPLINIDDFIHVTNALLARTKKDNMHTQWIFMKYPEDPPLHEYEPKYISLID